jgi:hypothetical protein
MDIPQLEAEIKSLAKEYADQHINNPTEAQYGLIEQAMIIGWQIGVRRSMEYMKDHGILPGN